MKDAIKAVDIYNQCIQIVQSYGPHLDDSHRNGIVNCIEHFKALFVRDYGADAKIVKDISSR